MAKVRSTRLSSVSKSSSAIFDVVDDAATGVATRAAMAGNWLAFVCHFNPYDACIISKIELTLFPTPILVIFKNANVRFVQM